MKNIKKIISLCLVCLFMVNGISASAATDTSTKSINTLGGTWNWTGFSTTESIMDAQEYPIQVVYLSADKVDAFKNSLIATNGFIEELIELGPVAFTVNLATKLGKKYGLELTPLAGRIGTAIGLATLLLDDNFRSEFLKVAAKSKTIKFTRYRTTWGGWEFTRWDTWDGKTMPEYIKLPAMPSVFAVGRVSINVVDLDGIDWRRMVRESDLEVLRASYLSELKTEQAISQ